MKSNNINRTTAVGYKQQNIPDDFTKLKEMYSHLFLTSYTHQQFWGVHENVYVSAGAQVTLLETSSAR